MAKLKEKEWQFPKEDSLDRITDAILWELTRTAYQESEKFRKCIGSNAWPMTIKQWPKEPYYSRKRKLAEFSFSMFSEPVNLWVIRKPDVLARLISNLRVKPSVEKDNKIVGIVGESPDLAMNESLGYGVTKFYADLRNPTPDLIKAFEKLIKQERQKKMPDICDRFGNLKKGKGLVKSSNGVAELLEHAQALLNSLGTYRIYKRSQESVSCTLDWMMENNIKLIDEKSIRDRVNLIKKSLKSIFQSYTISEG